MLLLRDQAILEELLRPVEVAFVEFHVNVRVDMKEFGGWPPERIAAFFNGIAAVLAAKGAIERESNTLHFGRQRTST